MSFSYSVTVGPEDFDVAAEMHVLQSLSVEHGAIASFTGLMRASNDGRQVQHMTLEYYPGMTAKAIEAICAEAGDRWPVGAIRVVHRVGDIFPGQQIVFVGVAAAHRGAAFQACEFVMDYLKTRAPFWKKEATDDGEHWVDAKHSDEDAANRW